MKQALDRFILAFPVLFIKQFPYAWIAAVTLWSWPPTVLSGFPCDHPDRATGTYAGNPAPGSPTCSVNMPLRMESFMWTSLLFHGRTLARKILILVAGAVFLAWLLKGQFGLSFWQIFLIIGGFTLLYRDTQFFGAPTTYVITDQGIGIHFVPGHIDYRLFLNFKEISRIEKSKYQKDNNWDAFVRNRNTQDGLLMTPKNPNGFTKRIEKLFIAPNDTEKFLEQLPHGYGRAP